MWTIPRPGGAPRTICDNTAIITNSVWQKPSDEQLGIMNVEFHTPMLDHGDWIECWVAITNPVAYERTFDNNECYGTAIFNFMDL